MNHALRALVLLAATLPAAGGHAAEQEPVTAVWKERQLYFTYRGFDAVYPCSVLQGRVARVLVAVGARPDLEVSVRHCDASFASATVPATGSVRWPRSPAEAGTSSGPTAAADYYRRSQPRQLADVSIRMSVPVEVTPEVAAELKTDRKRRELVAQVTGDPLPLFDDPILFSAERQTVTLSRDTGIEAFDCELLEQMALSLFRDLDVRVLRRGYRCDRDSVSRIPPKLEVEALIPVAPGGLARSGGMESESEDTPPAVPPGGASPDPATAEQHRSGEG